MAGAKLAVSGNAPLSLVNEALDPEKTGLIGVEFSPLTTSLGVFPTSAPRRAPLWRTSSPPISAGG
jgi:hypothetical protein